MSKMTNSSSTKSILLRVFKYALKSKTLLLVSLISLLIFSVLDIIQPLIIKKVIDDELSGVATVWVKTAAGEGSITFQGEEYKKDDGNTEGEKYTIYLLGDKYLLISGVLPEKAEVKIVGNEIIYKTENVSGSAPYQLLEKDDLLSFYQASIKPITVMIIFYAVIAVVILIFRYLHTVTFTTSSMRLTLDMRKNAFAKLNRLPISYFSKEPKGKTVTKIIYDSEGVRGIYQVVVQIFSALVSLLMIYVGFFALDYRLALLTFLAFPIIYLWMTVYRKTVNRYNRNIREMNSRINGKLAEFVNETSIIQAFNKEEKMAGEYEDMLLTNYRTKMKRLRINTFFGFQLLNLIRRLIIAFIIAYFSYQYLGTSIIVAGTTIYVYIEYLEKLTAPISDIFNNLNSFEDSLVSASRVFEFLDEEEDTGLGAVTGVEFNGAVEFKNIRFKYDEDNYVLKDISFNVKPGQFIGLVGKTGSGKTTLMSLLERYYDLEEGKILIDNVDYHQYSKQDVRNNIGIILQDPAIFEGTIKSNIAFGMDVEDEVIEELLEKIGANKFIDVLPNGIHSHVSYMGENLSTGEKQLIAFARILLRDPAIMILDEATANIDSETESLIQEALTVLSKERTTFVIAHRLSTIKNADVIYVMEDGRIIESGSHQELYEKENGVYRAMYDALN
jgi:ATP-binding cassette subfamily B multidrug efflux pump